MISYECDRQRALAKAKKLFEFKLENKKEKPVHISVGVNATETVSYSEWHKESRSHVKKYYTSYGEFFEVIRLPDLMKKDEILWSGVINIETIKKW